MPDFLLVFDLDGTLVDSVPDLRAALNQMLRERGRRALSSPQVQHMVTRLLNLSEIPEPPDASDALAIAICHLHTSATLVRQRAVSG